MLPVGRLCDMLEDTGITVLDTVPMLLTLLPRDVASLRVIILGGEDLPAHTARHGAPAVAQEDPHQPPAPGKEPARVAVAVAA